MARRWKGITYQSVFKSFKSTTYSCASNTIHALGYMANSVVHFLFVSVHGTFSFTDKIISKTLFDTSFLYRFNHYIGLDRTHWIRNLMACAVAACQLSLLYLGPAIDLAYSNVMDFPKKQRDLSIDINKDPDVLKHFFRTLGFYAAASVLGDYIIKVISSFFARGLADFLNRAIYQKAHKVLEAELDTEFKTKSKPISPIIAEYTKAVTDSISKLLELGVEAIPAGFYIFSVSAATFQWMLLPVFAGLCISVKLASKVKASKKEVGTKTGVLYEHHDKVDKGALSYKYNNEILPEVERAIPKNEAFFDAVHINNRDKDNAEQSIMLYRVFALIIASISVAYYSDIFQRRNEAVDNFTRIAKGIGHLAKFCTFPSLKCLVDAAVTAGQLDKEIGVEKDNRLKDPNWSILDYFRSKPKKASTPNTPYLGPMRHESSHADRSIRHDCALAIDSKAWFTVRKNVEYTLGDPEISSFFGIKYRSKQNPNIFSRQQLPKPFIEFIMKLLSSHRAGNVTACEGISVSSDVTHIYIPKSVLGVSGEPEMLSEAMTMRHYEDLKVPLPSPHSRRTYIDALVELVGYVISGPDRSKIISDLCNQDVRRIWNQDTQLNDVERSQLFIIGRILMIYHNLSDSDRASRKEDDNIVVVVNGLVSHTSTSQHRKGTGTIKRDLWEDFFKKLQEAWTKVFRSNDLQNLKVVSIDPIGSPKYPSLGRSDSSMSLTMLKPVVKNPKEESSPSDSDHNHLPELRLGQRQQELKEAHNSLPRHLAITHEEATPPLVFGQHTTEECSSGSLDSNSSDERVGTDRRSPEHWRRRSGELRLRPDTTRRVSISSPSDATVLQ